MSIKHLASEEQIINYRMICDEFDKPISYDSYYCYNDINKYDLSQNTGQIRTNVFICESPIVTGISTAIRK